MKTIYLKSPLPLQECVGRIIAALQAPQPRWHSMRWILPLWFTGYRGNLPLLGRHEADGFVLFARPRLPGFHHLVFHGAYHGSAPTAIKLTSELSRKGQLLRRGVPLFAVLTSLVLMMMGAQDFWSALATVLSTTLLAFAGSTLGCRREQQCVERALANLLETEEAAPGFFAGACGGTPAAQPEGPRG